MLYKFPSRTLPGYSFKNWLLLSKFLEDLTWKIYCFSLWEQAPGDKVSMALLEKTTPVFFFQPISLEILLFHRFIFNLHTRSLF